MENSYRDWYPWQLTWHSLNLAQVQSRLWLLWVYFVDWQRFHAGWLSSAVHRTWKNSCLFSWLHLERTSSLPPAFCFPRPICFRRQPIPTPSFLWSTSSPQTTYAQLQLRPPSVLAFSNMSQHKFSKTSIYRKHCSSSSWGPVRNPFVTLEVRCSASATPPTSVITSLSPPATTWPPTLSKGDHLKNMSLLCRSFYWMRHFKTPKIIFCLCELGFRILNLLSSCIFYLSQNFNLNILLHFYITCLLQMKVIRISKVTSVENRSVCKVSQATIRGAYDTISSGL